MSIETDAERLITEHGLAVFPTLPNSKAPATRNGFKDATKDLDVLARMFSDAPDGAGVAIATGSPSNIVVIDVDSRHGGDESLAELEAKHGALPDTVRSVTGGGGEHIYLLHPGGDIRNSAGALGAGLDVRARGGYVVAPPSLHESGRAYAWDRAPDEIGFALPSETLATLIRDSVRSDRQGARLPDRIPDGERNDRLFKFACLLRRGGMEADEIEAGLAASNHRCTPPLPPAELRRIAHSAARYPAATEDEDQGDQVDHVAALTGLVKAQGGDVEFVAPLKKIGRQRSTFFILARDQVTGETTEIGPLSRVQVRSMNTLADEIWDADCGVLIVQRKNGDRWHDFYRALKAATKTEDHHVTEESIWTPRVAKYLADRVTKGLNPTTKEGRLRVLELNGTPFTDPAGRVHINVEAFAEHLRPQRLDLSVPQIAAALKHTLGFESVTMQQRDPETNRNRKTNYWRAPDGFGWQS